LGGGPFGPFFFFSSYTKSYFLLISSSSVSRSLQMFGVPGLIDFVGEIRRPA
jgi:hypothetical protein